MTAHRYSTENQPKPTANNRTALDRTIRKLTQALEATDDPQMLVQITDRLTRLLEMREDKRKQRQERRKISTGLLGINTAKEQLNQAIDENKRKREEGRSALLLLGEEKEKM